MDCITTNSSGSLGKIDWCLICCSAYRKLKLSNPSTPTDNTLNKNNCLTKATEKIFECLLIPKAHLANLKKKKSLLSFCPNCMVIVEEIIELQKKAEILELQIRWKVETLGRIAIDTPAITRANGNDQKQVAEVWKTFKAPVTQNFLQGLLPNPSVNLVTAVNKNDSSSIFQKSRNCKSRTDVKNIKTERNKKRAFVKVKEEVISKKSIEVQDSDSDDDIFEMVSIPTSSSTKKEAKGNTSNKLKSFDFDVTTNTHRHQSIKDFKSTKITVKSETSLGFGNTEYAEKNRNRDDNHNKINTEESNADALFVGQSIPQKLESEMCKSDIGIGKRLRPRPARPQPPSPKRRKCNIIATTFLNFKNYVHGTSRRKRLLFNTRDRNQVKKKIVLDSLKCTKCDYRPRKTLNNQNNPSILLTNVANHYSNYHNPVNPTSIADGKYLYKCTDCDFAYSFHTFSTVNQYTFKKKLSLHYLEVHDGFQIQWDYEDVIVPSKTESLKKSQDDNKVQKGLKRKTLGGDYFKCTKCDFFAKRTPTSTPYNTRRKVVNHYGREHNPVKQNDLSKTIEGRYYYNCTKCNFSTIFESNTPKGHIYYYQKLSVHYMEEHDDDSLKRPSNSNSVHKIKIPSPIHAINIEGVEGQDYVKCTKCDFIATKSPTSSLYNARRRIINHYGREHNPVKSTDKSKTNNGKYCYKCTKCNFSTVFQSNVPNAHVYYYQKLSVHYMKEHDPFETQSSDSNNAHKIEIPTSSNSVNTEGVEGRDYFKCTKCDYIAKKNPATKNYVQNTPSGLRNKVAVHYSSRHNPVYPTNISKTIDGKDYYNCTKCSFSLIFQITNRNTRYVYHNKLSTHYMELHDVLESQSDSNPNDTFTEGLDYFLCPILNCTFVAFIKREGDQKQQFQNATEARLKLIEHYRTSLVHVKERNDILQPVTNPSLKLEGGVGVSFYECTNCDFKSFIREWENYTANAIDPGERARRALHVHYLLEHVFPWEIFPGLYKYGCYLEKSVDGNVLKCPYSDCEYFIKIIYDLEGKSQEECELEAYQSFTDHALNHNFNSIDFSDNNQFSALPAVEQINVDNFVNHGEVIQLNDEELEDSVGFQSSNLNINTNAQFNDRKYEEVTVTNEVWSGDYEEVEEIEIDPNPTVIEDQEDVTAEENTAEIIPVEPLFVFQYSEHLQEQNLETWP